MQLIDTHAHLDHTENIEEVLFAAHKAGVSAIVAVSEDLESSKKNLEIQSKFECPKILAAIGIHPGTIRAEEVDQTLEYIKNNCDKIVAIGEIGLDYWYRWVRKNDEKKQEQKNIFRLQLEIAKEYGLPVTIHSRGAWQDCLSIVKDVGIIKGVFHWYSGPLDVLREILDLGFYVSATPCLAYSKEAREAMEFVPIEKVLIETDSPVSYGKDDERFRAEPKDVFRTLKIYGELKNIDLQEASEILNQNAEKVFGK